MIPWMREKFAERRARWQAARKNRDTTTTNFALSPVSSSSECGSPGEKQRKHSASQSNPNAPSSSNETAESDVINTPEICVNVYCPQGQLIPMCLPSTATYLEMKLATVRKWKHAKVDELEERDEEDVQEIDVIELQRIGSLYKLIRTKYHKGVNEEETLATSCVNNNEEFLLALKKARRELKRDCPRAPTQLDIDKATEGMPPQRKIPPVVNIKLFEDEIKEDIRKVLISMTRASAYILGTGPFANRLISVLKRKLLNRKRHEVDVAESEMFVRMGFSQENAMNALKFNENNFSDALDWLIAKNWMELPENPKPLLKADTQSVDNDVNIKKNVGALLELLRITCQIEVEPTAEMIETIQGLGFEESRVREALRITRNNQEAACEWLLDSNSECIKELHAGLPKDSPILKTLMESPNVQLSLGNPQIFIAFLTILEHPDSLNMFMNDSEIAGVLYQILRTFHEEKHIQFVNQLNPTV